MNKVTMDTILLIKGKRYSIEEFKNKFAITDDARALTLAETLVKKGKATIYSATSQEDELLDLLNGDIELTNIVNQINDEEYASVQAKRNEIKQEVDTVSIALSFKTTAEACSAESYVNSLGIEDTEISIKGGAIKAINQYYNKRKAEIQSELKKVNKKDWSKRLQKLSDKRYEMIKFHMHCVSKYIIDWCVAHEIDTIIVGHNDNWKQENIGMQNFTYIPYELFFHILNYKSENVGIKYIENEEAYTSGTSFLDGEEPCKNNYNKERRIYRGLFISNKGVEINADVNGAYQIMKKVFPDVKFINGIEGVGLHPTIIKYFGNVNGKILPID